MWARILEFSLSCWLAISLLIFTLPEDHAVRLTEETLLLCILIAGCSLGSISKRFARLHLLNILFGLLLVGETLFQSPSPPAAFYQSRMIVGILLFILALIPVDSEMPSPSWRVFFKNEHPQK